LLERKIFPSDKNYILKEAQAFTRIFLLEELAKFVKQYYLSHHNPLGLIDETIRSIQESDEFPLEPFDEFYHDLSAIFRLKRGEVQLAFLFDGRSHFQKYEEDWCNFFLEQIKDFSTNRFFVRAVLDITVFHKTDRIANLAGDRLKYFLTQHYTMKVYKYRGIKHLEVL
jgi:hypothetical protein